MAFIFFYYSLCAISVRVFFLPMVVGRSWNFFYKRGGSWWLMVLFAKMNCDFRGGARGPSATSPQRNPKQTKTLQTQWSAIQNKVHMSQTKVCHPSTDQHLTIILARTYLPQCSVYTVSRAASPSLRCTCSFPKP
jgi:hypothetical protein